MKNKLFKMKKIRVNRYDDLSNKTDTEKVIGKAKRMQKTI